MMPEIEVLPDQLTRIGFRFCKMFITDRMVATIWPEGLSLCADIEAVSTVPDYHATAASCGYPGDDRDYRRYARHHEVVHNWLGDEQGWPSQTLTEAARGGTWEHWEHEEHHVNCLQRLWADSRAGIAWRDKEIEAAESALGPAWPAALIRLAALLDRLA